MWLENFSYDGFPTWPNNKVSIKPIKYFNGQTFLDQLYFLLSREAGY
jgi:hypothetical protein